jgi:hypothetical protein
MKTFTWILVLAPMLLLGSCTSSPSSTEGAAELKTNTVTGSVSTTLPAGLEESFDAAEWAVDEMKYTVTKKAEDALKGVISAKTADGTNVEIVLDKNGSEVTNLSVSAGPTKTEISRALVTKIQDRVD